MGRAPFELCIDLTSLPQYLASSGPRRRSRLLVELGRLLSTDRWGYRHRGVEESFYTFDFLVPDRWKVHDEYDTMQRKKQRYIGEME